MKPSLTSKLKRELRTSPKKAGLLGLLLLVAMYYWLPLAYHWLGGGSSHGGTPTTVAASTSTIAPPAAGAAALAAPPKFTWQQVAKAVDADQRMTSVASVPLGRDPFEKVYRKVVDESKAAETVKIAPVVTPESAGLVLSSTVVGSKSSLAIVNGKTYHLGDQIHAAAKDEEVMFRVAEIHNKQIVVERENKRFTLALRVDLAESDFVGLGAPTRADGSVPPGASNTAQGPAAQGSTPQPGATSVAPANGGTTSLVPPNGGTAAGAVTLPPSGVGARVSPNGDGEEDN